MAERRREACKPLICGAQLDKLHAMGSPDATPLLSGVIRPSSLNTPARRPAVTSPARRAPRTMRVHAHHRNPTQSPTAAVERSQSRASRPRGRTTWPATRGASRAPPHATRPRDREVVSHFADALSPEGARPSSMQNLQHAEPPIRDELPCSARHACETSASVGRAARSSAAARPAQASSQRRRSAHRLYTPNAGSDASFRAPPSIPRRPSRRRAARREDLQSLWRRLGSRPHEKPSSYAPRAARTARHVVVVIGAFRWRSAAAALVLRPRPRSSSSTRRRRLSLDRRPRRARRSTRSSPNVSASRAARSLPCAHLSARVAAPITTKRGAPRARRPRARARRSACTREVDDTRRLGRRVARTAADVGAARGERAAMRRRARRRAVSRGGRGRAGERRARPQTARASPSSTNSSDMSGITPVREAATPTCSQQRHVARRRARSGASTTGAPATGVGCDMTMRARATPRPLGRARGSRTVTRTAVDYERLRLERGRRAAARPPISRRRPYDFARAQRRSGARASCGAVGGDRGKSSCAGGVVVVVEPGDRLLPSDRRHEPSAGAHRESRRRPAAPEGARSTTSASTAESTARASRRVALLGVHAPRTNRSGRRRARPQSPARPARARSFSPPTTPRPCAAATDLHSLSLELVVI